MQGKIQKKDIYNPKVSYRQKDGRQKKLNVYRRLTDIRIEHRIELQQPMIIISQVSRSGGTLLSTLLDGHNQIYAHPYELYIGYPEKWRWPTLDLSAGADEWLTILEERPSFQAFKRGYCKPGKAAANRPEIHPFIFIPQVQKAIFNDSLANKCVRTSRHIFDSYFTSYFNAWIDYQNLYGTEKKFISAFVPHMLNKSPSSIEQFFNIYPDGRFCAIIRNPVSWFASYQQHTGISQNEVSDVIPLWLSSVHNAMSMKKKYGPKVILLSFERLVTDTDAYMKKFAGLINVHATDSLSSPTFNNRPIIANSSFRVGTTGSINKDSSDRSANVSQDLRNEIKDLTDKEFNRVSNQLLI